MLAIANLVSGKQMKGATRCIFQLALLPSLPTIQFLLLLACSMQRGRPGLFYHVNGVLST